MLEKRIGIQRSRSAILVCRVAGVSRRLVPVLRTLAEAAKSEPAFRAAALAALGALNDVHAADALHDLFDVHSAETRYGAFRALWAMNEHDPQLRGEHLDNKFWLHDVPSRRTADGSRDAQLLAPKSSCSAKVKNSSCPWHWKPAIRSS